MSVACFLSNWRSNPTNTKRNRTKHKQHEQPAPTYHHKWDKKAQKTQTTPLLHSTYVHSHRLPICSKCSKCSKSQLAKRKTLKTFSVLLKNSIFCWFRNSCLPLCHFFLNDITGSGCHQKKATVLQGAPTALWEWSRTVRGLLRLSQLRKRTQISILESQLDGNGWSGMCCVCTMYHVVLLLFCCSICTIAPVLSHAHNLSLLSTFIRFDSQNWRTRNYKIKSWGVGSRESRDTCEKCLNLKRRA